MPFQAKGSLESKLDLKYKHSLAVINASVSLEGAEKCDRKFHSTWYLIWSKKIYMSNFKNIFMHSLCQLTSSFILAFTNDRIETLVSYALAVVCTLNKA